MRSEFEGLTRKQLLSEIDGLEKNYATIKRVLSGAQYDVSDIRGALLYFRNHFIGLQVSFTSLSESKRLGRVDLPNSVVKAMDLAMVLTGMFAQERPSSVIQLALAVFNVELENVMSLISILKKIV
jgi:hypothetical protein